MKQLQSQGKLRLSIVQNFFLQNYAQKVYRSIWFFPDFLDS